MSFDNMLTFSYTPQFNFSNFFGNVNTLPFFRFNFPPLNFLDYKIDFSNLNTLPISYTSSTTQTSRISPEDFQKQCFGRMSNFTLNNTQPQQPAVSIFNTHTPKYSSNTDNFSPKTNKFVTRALSFVGKVHNDTEGNKLFSNGRKQPWCADFVSYIYGDSTGFRTSSVSALKTWGANNGAYKDVPSANKAQYIASNVKPGDIMIEKRNGKSHTGIVTKVNSDGSFETVEGNCSNSVKTVKYTASSKTLSGFIDMSQYA